MDYKEITVWKASNKNLNRKEVKESLCKRIQFCDMLGKRFLCCSRTYTILYLNDYNFGKRFVPYARTKGSKNKPKTVTADFATQIAEKQSAKAAAKAAEEAAGNFEKVSKMGHMHRSNGSWCRSLFKEGIDRILMQSRFEEIL